MKSKEEIEKEIQRINNLIKSDSIEGWNRLINEGKKTALEWVIKDEGRTNRP